MNIQQIRQQYPQYEDLSDTQLAERLRQAFYPDLDPEDFNKRIGLSTDTTLGGNVKEFFKGVIPGAVGLGETAITGAAALLPDQMEDTVRGGVKTAADAARAPFKAAPGYEQSVGRKFGEAVGSTVPFLAMGPLGAAGKAGMVGLGVGAGAGEARVRAEQAGATDEQRGEATALGIIPGAMEAFAPMRILNRIPTAAKAGGVAMVKRALAAGGEEAAQEAASGWAQNLIAQRIYAPEQALIEGLGEQAAYGGATGALIQGVMDLALGRRARGVPAQEEPPSPPQEDPAQAQRLQAQADPRQMGPTRQLGAQQQIPGVDAVEESAPTPRDPQEMLQEREQLRALLRNPDTLYEMERNALRNGRSDGPSAVQQIKDAKDRLAALDADLKAAGVEDNATQQASVAQRLRKAQQELANMAQQEDAQYDPEQVDKLKRRIARLQSEAEDVGGAQDSFTPDLFGTINITEKSVGKNVAADRAGLGAQMGQQRETLTQRRQQIEEEIARLRTLGQGDPNDPESAAVMRRNAIRERELQAELAQIEQQAAGTSNMVQQPRLFGEPEETARVGTGTAGTARSEAEIMADLQIARASRDKERTSEIVEELRALRDATRTRDAEGKAKQTDVSNLRSKDLEQAAGMKVPEDTARRQSFTDARYRAFGQMVSTLDRFNRGAADSGALRAAEQQVADNLVREIDALTGEPMTVQQRQSVLAEARDLLSDLKRRFGDTRSEVNLGTRKEPEMEPVQRGGQFRTDLPGAGAGPTGMGLENFETRDRGDRTFGNRYAAAQSILEGLDQIRNRRAGTQETARGTDRTDSNRTDEQRLAQAQQQARGTPAEALVQQVQDSRVKTPALVEGAVQAAQRAQRGQGVEEQQRSIADELARLEQGKRSETEGGATAVQTDMFGGTGTIFNSYAEFDEWLGSTALQALKLSQGQTRETLSRAIKMVAPLQKRAADLEAQVRTLVDQKNALLGLRNEEDATSRKRVADAEAKLALAQDDMEYAVSDYREALLNAQQKLQDAQTEDAQIAAQIANNMAALEAPVQAARGDQTAMIGAARKLAQAKDALAKYTPTLFNSADPISRPKLAEYRRLEAAVDAAQAALVKASDKARASTTGAFEPQRVAQFQQQAAELAAQRKTQLRRIAGLTGARNRAQRSLDAAVVAAGADPELVAQLARAQEMIALAASMRKDSLRGIAAVDAEIGAMNETIQSTGSPAPTLRRMAVERIRDAQGKPARQVPAETQGDREARDGERRKAEQAVLETRQEGPGTTRESVSFEPRRMDQENLDEASARMAALEDILARVPMNEEQRAQFEEAAVEYKARTDALEKKAQARLENVEGKLSAQRKRIEMLQRAQAEYDAADVDSPQRARAQDRVARLQDQIAKQGAAISKAWGIRRERVVSQAEKQARADQTLQETRGKAVTAADEQLTEGQTKRRTSSPATRETRQTGGFRTGNAETVDERSGAQRQRIVESQRPKERDTPISKAEQQVANAEAQRIQDEARKANAEAERLKKGTPPKRRKQVDEAQTVGQILIRAMEPKVKGPKSRTADAIDDMELDTDGYDDALLREDNAFYEERATNDLSEEAAEAAFDGRTLDLLDDIAANGATPALRAVAKAVRPFLLRTRIRTQDMLKIGGRRAEGAFYPARNEVVLDSMAMTQETALHELVHAATMRAIAGDVQLNPEQQKALEDLQALFDRIKDTPAFSKEYARKDLLEFTAELMTNPAVREKLDRYNAGSVPLLTRIYNGILRMLGVSVPSASTKAMADTMRLFAPSRSFNYRNQGVPSIMRGAFPGTGATFNPDVPQNLQTLATGTVGKNPTIKDKILANVAGFRMQFIDRFDPYEDLMRKGVAKGLINDLQASQYSYFMRFGEQRNQFVEQAATNGVPQLRKTAEGDFVIETPDGEHPNLMKIAQALGKANVGNEQATEQMFTTYLAVLRGEQVGFDKLNFDRPVTPAMAGEIKAFVAADPQRKEAFESARKMYREYNNGLLDFLVQTGAMDKPQATALKKGDYVPYYRQDASGVVNLIIAGETPVRIGNIKDQPYLKELVGGNDKILPFFTGAMQNTSMLIDMALRNKQTMEMSNMLQKLGLGKIRSNAGPDNGNSVNFKIEGAQVHLNIDSAVKDWGVPADLLVKGLEGIKTTIPAGLRFMQVPANLLRTMITRAPAYAIRQIIREPINAWLVSGGNFTPVASSVKELTKIRMGTSTGAQALERSGAVSSNVITGDQQDQARILRDVAQGKTLWHKVMMEADKFAMQGDTATRAVLYDKFRKQGMTHMQATLGALESMNFARRGLSPTMQMMSMLVPFFNAQVQGLDVIYRAAKGQTTFDKKLDVQRKLMTRGAMMMAGTLAYAAMMQDDEAYKNATPQERAQNWFLPLPGFDEPLRIPIPFELGFAFKALPEVMFNTAFGDTQAKDAAKAMGALAYNSLPIGMPQAIKPAVEVMANYSFYTGDSIEGRREQTVQKGERFRDNTTELAKILGKAEVVSPVQIDYLIRGYTGGLGLTLVGLSNFALRMANPSEALADGATKKASQTPLLGALFQPADGRGVIDEAFKDIESWQQATQTYKRMIEQGRGADAQKFAQDFSTQLALNATGGAFRQQMGELAQVRRAVLASKDLTPDQKRAQVDQIRQLELALSRQIREAQRQAGG